MVVSHQHLHVFISAVSSEFGEARKEIERDLRGFGLEVKTQDNFLLDGKGEPTLYNLHKYIEGCWRVICIIGKRSGTYPPPAAAEKFKAMLPEGFSEASYTQWEFFFARQYKKPLFIYMADEDYIPDKSEPTGKDYPDLQQELIHYIQHVHGLDRREFSNIDQLCRLVLKQDWREPDRFRPLSLPYPSVGELFKGREESMQQLTNSFIYGFGPSVVVRALHGLGGTGKTRAAVEYAWRHQNKYSALLLVSAESIETLRLNLAALTQLFELPESNSPDDEVKLRAVLRWLSLHPTWLLILDGLNAQDTLKEASRLMGRMNHGDIIITSQLSDFPADIMPIELDALDADAAEEFLLERTKYRRRPAPDDSSKARKLATRLGNLAFFLENAAAFIAEKRLTFDAYLDDLPANLPVDASPGRLPATHYSSALAATWRTSVSRLSERARRLLQRLAWFSTEAIPEFLLDEKIPEPRDESMFDALDELSGVSLVKRSWENPSFSVHRLVQDTTRLYLGDERRGSLEEAVRWMDTAFIGDPANAADWPRLDPLWPHALAIAEHAEREKVDSTRLTSALGVLLTAKTRHAQRDIEHGFSPRVWLPPTTALTFRHAKFEKALEPLRGLTNLEELSLAGIYVGDAAPLAKWANLQRLDLGRTEVIDIAPLAHFKTLRKLDLWRTKVRDIAAIEQLTNLQDLSLGHTWVKDISALAGLSRLQCLDLSDTPIREINKLDGLSNLVRLSLGGTSVRDISPLQRLTKLRTLDLSDTEVTDLAPIANHGELEELRLNGAKVRNVSAIAGLTKLKRLDLSGTKVIDVSALCKLIGLQVLSLGGCAVADVTDLAGLSNLQVLNLGFTRIGDVEALGSLARLRSLDLRGTRVHDLRPIANLSRLQGLDLAYSKVTKVAALATLPCLNTLHLEDCRVIDRAALDSNKGLKILPEI
jgi:Leucine-rich repeat (LRR) protein